jgi:hypothetical protein
MECSQRDRIWTVVRRCETRKGDGHLPLSIISKRNTQIGAVKIQDLGGVGAKAVSIIDDRARRTQAREGETLTFAGSCSSSFINGHLPGFHLSFAMRYLANQEISSRLDIKRSSPGLPEICLADNIKS